ncbi:hypothetical protein HY638_05810 [Candidatus Woesearchaeota archaeon]|nr:hypothetical protein [Candidatus Woesearchaeota archaeon]
MALIELVGYAAMVVMALSLTPQVIKSWRTKSTKDISILWNSLYIFGLVLWLVYGIGINSWPLVGGAVIESVLAISLIVLKVRYG